MAASQEGRTLRIFLDANVLFSAARAAGAMRQLLTALAERGHILVVDGYVLTEARRNLAAKVSEAAVLDLEQLVIDMQVGGAKQPLEEAQVADWLPDKDRPVLLSAMALRCDALVTGDRTHFGAGYGQSFTGVTIYSPAQLALALLPPAP